MRRFLRDGRGNVAILTALMMPVLCGVGALAVDTANVKVSQQQLQTAADAAALAAAQSLGNLASARVAAREVAASNMEAGLSPVVVDGDIRFGKWDSANRQFTEVATGITAVQVTAVRSRARSNPVTTAFAGVLGFQFVDVSASAIAAGVAPVAVPACVYALDPATKESFLVSGSGVVNVPNCGIQVNSSSSTALKQSGSGSIKGKVISVVGGFGAASNISPTPIKGAPALPDPLRSLPEPSIPSACTFNNTTFSTPRTFAGGTVFCGTIGFNADITFGPGIHYFKAAKVTAGSSAGITGNRVMLFFDDTSTWDSTGSGIVSITAPDSGVYEGVAFFGSRMGKMSTFKLRGSKDYNVFGTMYLPTQRLEFYGSLDLYVSSRSGYVVAWQFFYQGSSSFTFDSFGGSAPPLLTSSSARTQLVN